MIALKITEIEMYLQNLLGSRYQSFLTAKSEPRAIRINSLKSESSVFLNRIRNYKVPLKPISFNKNGFIIEHDLLPLSHTLDFFRGLFQYQGISSQIPVKMLAVKRGESVLDFAAAPGSKSTQLAADMENSGVLVLNDPSLSRLQALNANLQRSGAVNFYILKNFGDRLGQLFPEYFDKILLDAPCTALGTLASNPEINAWWNYDRLLKLANVQKYLLKSAFKALKPGGEMVYSTCSVGPEENELIIDELITQYPVEIVPVDLNLEYSPGFTYYQGKELDSQLQHAIRIWPDIHGMEGFFAVKLRKIKSIGLPGASAKVNRRKTKTAKNGMIEPILKNLESLWGISLENWENYRFLLSRDKIWLVAKEIEDVVDTSFISAGMLLAEKRLSGWKLTNASVQFFASKITKRQIEISDDALTDLFAHGSTTVKGIANGYHALFRRSEAIGSVFVENDEMRLRLPHQFRLILSQD